MDQLSLVNSPADQLLFNTSTHKNEYYTADGWTFAENKLYESALAMCEDTNSSAFFEHVAFLMPWKTIEAIQFHHQLLLKNVEAIESSNVSLDDVSEAGAKLEEPKQHTRRPKKKAVSWTREEHMSFLRGLQACGKGDWKRISKDYVPTRTPAQIASHSQKFEKRMNIKTPAEKRRKSINDIQCPCPIQCLCSCSPIHSNPLQNLAGSSHMCPTSNLWVNQNGGSNM